MMHVDKSFYTNAQECARLCKPVYQWEGMLLQLRRKKEKTLPPQFALLRDCGHGGAGSGCRSITEACSEAGVWG